MYYFLNSAYRILAFNSKIAKSFILTYFWYKLDLGVSDTKTKKGWTYLSFADIRRVHWGMIKLSGEAR